MSARPRVGLLGGTFDPIHNGHLAAARAAQQSLDLDRVRFIPAARPPHRPDSPVASEYHRLQMVRLAADEDRRWEVSDLELRRQGPSFTFDTLAALHAEGLTPLQIFFLTGADAFADIGSWRHYPALLDSAHFAVVARPGSLLRSLPHRMPALAARMIEPDAVDTATQPRVILIEALTPDVSSTDIRQRIRAGVSIDDLVPASVAAYIAQHSLYQHAGD
jgi:nicotinate-nucleotide adenylyltransferase